MSAGSGNLGDWVEVRLTLLRPEQRSSSLPDDTQGVPLEARVKGYLTEEAVVGDDVEIETVLGRRVRGTLSRIRPRPGHSFGPPAPELLGVGEELRARLARQRADG